MTIFHYQKSDDTRSTRENETATYSISPHEMRAQFARSCSRVGKNSAQPLLNLDAGAWLELPLLSQNTPYSLAKLSFYDSLSSRRRCGGIPQDGRAPSAKHPAGNPASCLAQHPQLSAQAPYNGVRHVQSVSGQTTRKTTCNAARNTRETASEPTRERFSVTPLTLFQMSYEYDPIATNSESRNAAPSGAGISAQSPARSIQQPEAASRRHC